MTRVGQFTVPPSLAVHRAAAAVAKNTQSGSQAAGIVPSLRQAQVVSIDGGTPPTVTVTFDGTTNVPGIGYASSCVPQIGDIVYCDVLGGATWVMCKLAETTHDSTALGATGSADNGYTTQPGIAYHLSDMALATGTNELHSDYRITVPACSGRQIELHFNALLQFIGSATAGNAIVIQFYTYSSGLGSPQGQRNYSGVNGDWTGVAMRSRFVGASSSTTYTVTAGCGGGNLGTVKSASNYPALFTIDDVGPS